MLIGDSFDTGVVVKVQANCTAVLLPCTAGIVVQQL